jgi:prepilin-type N-terminal cleavage/methylation domain-containing protein
MKARHAMTLLELMVVISILAAFTVLAIPAMRGPHEKNKLRTASREIVSLLRYARSAAVFNETDVVLEIDVEAGLYRLDLGKMATPERRGHLGPEPRDVELWHETPKGVIFLAVFSWDDPDEKEGWARIRFYPDGSASDSMVVLENSRTQHMTIGVNRATGRPEIYIGLPENWETLTFQPLGRRAWEMAWLPGDAAGRKALITAFAGNDVRNPRPNAPRQTPLGGGFLGNESSG